MERSQPRPDSPEILKVNEKDRWDGRVVYQIYPNTFNEVRETGQEHTGYGSLAGITEKLDYVRDLGANAIWLNPMYPDGGVDGGYDIADYTDIRAELGTMEDFDRLIAAAHERDILVMLDFVPSHSSDKHPWFEASRVSRDNPHSDTYIWRDAAPDGGPPNNWASVFSIPNLEARNRGEMPHLLEGEPTPPISAWRWDDARQQYYLHTFAVEQPDLNWTNPAVRDAMKQNMRFWFDRGVDAFRVDAVNHAGKHPDIANPAVDPRVLNERINPNYREGIDNPYDRLMRENSADYMPSLTVYLQEMIEICREYPGRRLVFEAYTTDENLAFIDALAPDCAGTFDFRTFTQPWDSPAQKEMSDNYHRTLSAGALPTPVRTNHDKPSIVNQLGSIEAAKASAVEILMKPGLPFIYNGEELGRHDVIVAEHRVQDPNGGRDGVRTPMWWNGEVNAGFSRASEEALWLPFREEGSTEYLRHNAESQSQDEGSVLSFYRVLLHMRQAHETLQQRNNYYQVGVSEPQHTRAFARRHGIDQLMVATNYSDIKVNLALQGTRQAFGRVVLSSLQRATGREISLIDGFALLPKESVVIMKDAVATDN